MMDFSAAHVDMVIASYALTSLCLIGLAVYLLFRDRKIANTLSNIDKS